LIFPIVVVVVVVNLSLTAKIDSQFDANLTWKSIKSRPFTLSASIVQKEN
jgi:hypothetical protein